MLLQWCRFHLAGARNPLYYYFALSSSSSSSNVSTANRTRSVLPGIRRILLIRHGESLGNIDERAYGKTADWQIPLTKRGREQARIAGKKVASYIIQSAQSSSNSNIKDNNNIFFYVSPYLRTRQTLREILSEIPKEKILGIREDPRISEQQFGNFQSHNTMQDNKATRVDFGRFYYRFPEGGESGFDVYNRVSGFIGTLKRDSSEYYDNDAKEEEEDYSTTICIVTHGLSLRLFLMRWFQYSVHEFERSYNPKNAAVVCLERAPGGWFELSAVDRIAMGFPSYHEQERFRFIHDYSLLDKSSW
jgi:broad specificity phosphatase PhoE